MAASLPFELLHKLPKTDLHCHLDGSLRLVEIPISACPCVGLARGGCDYEPRGDRQVEKALHAHDSSP